jgi:hypothetical protein
LTYGSFSLAMGRFPQMACCLYLPIWTRYEVYCQAETLTIANVWR